MIYLAIKTHHQQTIAVTYNRATDHWQEYTSPEITTLTATLTATNQPIIGWNSDAHDLPPIIDLAAHIHRDTGRRPSLAAMAAADLLFHYLVPDQQIAAWLKSGDPQSLAHALAACKEEVRVLAHLHARILHGGALRIPPDRAHGELGELIWWGSE